VSTLEQRARAALARLARQGHDRWLICLSGGLDSRVLYHLAALHAAEVGATLASVHVHHGLRESADVDATFCEQLARSHDYPVHIPHKTIRLEVEKGNSTQRSARIARWAAIARAMAAHGMTCALTAHHEDDRFETMLINATRGAGLVGLAALSEPIAPFPLGGASDSSFVVARPLLEVSREEIEDYARTHDLAWIEDPTNATDLYARNKLRHHVLPQLLAEPHARQGLRQTLDNLAASARETLEEAHDLLERALREVEKPGEVALSRDIFQAASERSRARAILILAEKLHARWDSEVIARIERALEKPRHKESLPDVWLRLDQELLRLTPTHGTRGDRSIVEVAHEIPIDLDRPNSSIPWFGDTLFWEVLAVNEAASAKTTDKDSGSWIVIDRSLLEEPLLLRGPRPGERIRLANERDVKIKELLRSHGVDAELRWRQGCLVSAEHVLWLPLLGVCADITHVRSARARTRGSSKDVTAKASATTELVRFRWQRAGGK
jgi:tRNA(Ile)-lysidine synthetase-like protein